MNHLFQRTISAKFGFILVWQFCRRLKCVAIENSMTKYYSDVELSMPQVKEKKKLKLNIQVSVNQVCDTI
jgi:hypothetical protein